MVPHRGPGSKQVCLGPASSVLFLTLCRKDFTTRVQVIMRVCLLKLGTVKQGMSEYRRCNRRNLGWAALAHWEVKEKKAWRQVQGLVRDKLLLPIAPLVASLVGTLRV